MSRDTGNARTLMVKATAEGGAIFARRRDGTGWARMAGRPVADTDSGLIAAGRIVVGRRFHHERVRASESSPE